MTSVAASGIPHVRLLGQGYILRNAYTNVKVSAYFMIKTLIDSWQLFMILLAPKFDKVSYSCSVVHKFR